MKRVVEAFALGAAGVLATFGCASNQSTSSTGCCCGAVCSVPAGAAVAVDSQTAAALRETLMDERRAQAFYSSVIARHGQVRPFSHIVHAEERHEAMIATLMARHGVAIPDETPLSIPGVPDTLSECSRVAAQLERENIAMYDRLLGEVKEPDVRAAFQSLRAASQDNHLPAFERWSMRSAPAGNRWSCGGRGNGWCGRTSA